MFQHVEPAQQDPILGLTEAFKNDPRTHKINLGVGVYQDAAGSTPTLPSVKAAAGRVAAASKPRNFCGKRIAGSAKAEHGNQVRDAPPAVVAGAPMP